jgi:hypothetical protein
MGAGQQQSQILQCDWLATSQGYIFTSWNAAWNHVVATYGPQVKQHGMAFARSGPCPGVGYHWNIRRTIRNQGSRKVASIVQCPCEDQNGQPRERYRVI